MIQEQELKTFVEGTTNYFEVAAQQLVQLAHPAPALPAQPPQFGFVRVAHWASRPYASTPHSAHSTMPPAT